MVVVMMLVVFVKVSEGEQEEDTMKTRKWKAQDQQARGSRLIVSGEDEKDRRAKFGSHPYSQDWRDVRR